MQIPSENLYFVLSYAWKRLDRLKSVLEIVQSGRYDLPQDLLGCLLRESFSRLLRRHLDRGYRERDEDTCRPRGKVDFASTIRRALGVRGQAHVRYEELSRDTLQIESSRRECGASRPHRT